MCEDLAVIEWGWVGYELIMQMRELSTEAECRGA